jgi:NDP-sugar pyrophosphorylase family protein
VSRKSLEDIDVAILAGGLGTRIRDTLGDTPKVLAPINGRPYLDYLLDWLDGFGASRIIMCLGHLAQKVEDHLQGREGVECIVEPEPLGTGGAVRFCRDAFRSNHLLVMNGDTWLEMDLDPFVATHLKSNSNISMVCVQVDDVSRYGNVIIHEHSVMGFTEKNLNNTGPGFINGGAYLLSQKVLDELCRMNVHSIENDFFFKLKPGSIRAFIPEKANFIDIGTPESLDAAVSVLPV